LPEGTPIAMRAVYGMGVMEGAIAAGLSAIQDRFANVDLGSYPFRRAGAGGVAIVAKGTDPKLLEQAIAEASQLLAAQGHEPVQGEPN
jgi:molybdopterin-biosynthesis enzyme MoeA-like protein